MSYDAADYRKIVLPSWRQTRKILDRNRAERVRARARLLDAIERTLEATFEQEDFEERLSDEIRLIAAE